MASTCRSNVAQTNDITHLYNYKNKVRMAYKEEEDEQEPKR